MVEQYANTVIKVQSILATLEILCIRDFVVLVL